MTKGHFPLLTFWVLLIWLLPPLAQAHSLGIDPADLIEQAPGQYSLTAKVPPQLQSAITTPILPNRCAFTDDPAGIASPSGIRLISSANRA